MSAAAINTAPTPAAGATAAAGASTGVGGAHGAQVTGLPAIFEAMLATLTQAEDAATAGVASVQAAAGGKVVAGAAKTPDDGKTKGKTADATDGQAATATATGTTVPDATVALLVPAPTSATTQASAAVAGDDAAGGQANSSGPKTPALPVAAALAQGADADADAGKAKTAALAADSAGLNAPANAKTDAIPTAAQAPAATQAAAMIPAPTDASAAAQVQAPGLEAAANTAAEAAAQASAQASVQSGAKTAPSTATLTPVDGKAAASKVVRSDVAKASSGPTDATALFASNAGKNADALAPIAGAASKAGSPDKGSQAAADTEADQPAASQAPADPATSATTTPATLIAAAAVAVRGSPETVANLAAQIVKKLDARSTQFEVQLDPAGLGKVDVRVEIGADGKMSAAMSFDTPQAAAELRARSNELQQALAQSGFDVSGGMSFDVSTDRGQNGQAQNQQPQAGAAFRGRAFQAALDTTADTPPATLFTRQRSSASGVDIRI
jgi:flagellar hook-length control protein FliK